MKPAYLNRLTLRQIQVFLAVCRLTSYSKAAEELGLTQPAVSAQIRQLEDVIGEPLFDYLGKQLYLTPAGEALRRAGRDLLQRLVSLEMELAELQGVMQGTLNLAVESSAQYFMPGELARFCAQHPAVSVDLEVVNHSEALRRLADNRDDLVVMGLVPEGRALAFIPFRDNAMVAVAAPGNPLCGLRSISLLDLAEQTLLVREAGSGTRKAFETYCLQQGVRFPRRQQLGSLEAVKCGVQAQLGVAVLPREAVTAELVDGRLLELDVSGLPLRRSWCVVYPREKNLTPVAAAFLRHLTVG
jgi:LysR family transcriptional regulator, putative pyruvate carboxylase regulator